MSLHIAAATKLQKQVARSALVPGLHYGIRLDKGIPILNHTTEQSDAALSCAQTSSWPLENIALASFLCCHTNELKATPSVHHISSSLCFRPGGTSQAEKLASFSVCARQRSLAWPGRPSSVALGRVTKHVRKHNDKTSVASMYSPCLGLDGFGTTQSGWNECGVEARCAHVVVVVSVCCRP